MDDLMEGTALFRTDLEQGTPEWLAWRRQGVGASEVAVLLGLSDDSTPYKMWQDKLGLLKEPDRVNHGMLTGHEREAQVRAGLELELDGTFSAVLVEACPGSIFRVSLDGWDEAQGAGFEMKYVGKDYYEQGGLPTEEHAIKAKHLAQMQYQMMVTRAPWWYYVKTIDGQNFKVQKVMADRQQQLLLRAASACFWPHVESKNPPPYCDLDWVPDERPELVAALADVQLFGNLGGKEAKQKKEEARAKVFGLVKQARTVCGAARISVLPTVKRIVFSEAADAQA